MFYELLWYDKRKGNEDPVWREFKTKKQALCYYEKIKNDNNLYDFWLTKRNEEGEVLEDIIY